MAVSCGPGLAETSSPFTAPAWPQLAARAETSAPNVGELAQLLARIARERGLLPRATPALLELSGLALTRRAMAQVRRDTPERVRAAHAQLLLRLELVPAGFEWLPAMEAALQGRLEAFYDPGERSIFIDRALLGSARQRALAHELVHALQDQHHDLGARLAYAPDAWDRQSALHALAEGDAEVLVSQLSLPGPVSATGVDESRTLSGIETSADTPRVLVRSLSAAYVDGRALVERVHATGGWEAVDALFTNPPTTTHEMLHPDAARPARAAGALSVGLPPDPTWQLLYSDVLGEQTWRIVLEEWVTERAAEQAARGWVADRLECFKKGGAHALVWELHTADASGASRAWNAVLEGLEFASLDAARGERDPRFRCRAHRDSGVIAALRSHHQLWLLSLSELATEAGCPMMADWAEQLVRLREGGGSDLGPSHLTGPR